MILQKDIYKIINKTLPDEIYFLAGQSSVGVSFQKPVITYLSNNIPLFYILEYCRLFNKKLKFIILHHQNVLEIIIKFL